MSPTPVGLETLRPDLQRCVNALHAADAGKFLSWCGAWGSSLNDAPDDESFLTVLPVLALKGRGVLALSPRRLLFSGEFGRLEVPGHRLRMSEVGVDRHTTTLRVGVGPSNDPVHEFGISILKRESLDHFLRVWETFVREAENPHARRESPVSTADELAKFSQLRDQGVITDAEFEAKKAQLLS